MKPDWSKAPEGANYHTVDADGQSNWHQDRPCMEGCLWNSDGQMWRNNFACPHWKETLEERPKSLEIKEGGVYRMRDGKKAWVLKILPGLNYPYIGVLDNDQICASGSWASGGRFDINKDHGWDLIAEWEESS
jgi:hypothetical protein